MSGGVFAGPGTGGGYGRAAADIEDEIARVAGLPAPERQTAREFLGAPGRASTPDPGALIAGVNVAAKVINSAYGEVALSPYALGVIVSVCTRELRNHLDRQIADLNERLGVPREVVELSATATAAPSPRKGRKPLEQIELPLGSTQGAAEGAEV